MKPKEEGPSAESSHLVDGRVGEPGLPGPRRERTRDAAVNMAGSAEICNTACAERLGGCIREMKSQKNELPAIARARLYPSLSNPNYLLLRSRRIILENWIEQLPERGLTVLDVGGSYQPYRSLLGERIKPYIALDLQKTELVDGVGSGEAVPFAASSFDLVIATQVFEYFREPARAAEQIDQALKPGGVLLMSVAAMAPGFRRKSIGTSLPRVYGLPWPALPKWRLFPRAVLLAGWLAPSIGG